MDDFTFNNLEVFQVVFALIAGPFLSEAKRKPYPVLIIGKRQIKGNFCYDIVYLEYSSKLKSYELPMNRVIAAHISPKDILSIADPEAYPTLIEECLVHPMESLRKAALEGFKRRQKKRAN